MAKKQNTQVSNIETPKYNGWLVSDSFIKRAFAVYGHLIVAQLIIVGVSFTVFFIFGFILGMMMY